MHTWDQPTYSIMRHKLPPSNIAIILRMIYDCIVSDMILPHPSVGIIQRSPIPNKQDSMLNQRNWPNGDTELATESTKLTRPLTTNLATTLDPISTDLWLLRALHARASYRGPTWPWSGGKDAPAPPSGQKTSLFDARSTHHGRNWDVRLELM